MASRITGSTSAPGTQEQFFWSIRSLSALFDQVHGIWAGRMGVTIPQITLLFALKDFGSQTAGLSVKQVARILGVDPAFATTQSKILEARGLIDRTPSVADGRVVLLSLNSRAQKLLSAFRQDQKKMNDYIFSEFTEQGIQTLVMKVATVQHRLEKAKAVAAIKLED